MTQPIYTVSDFVAVCNQILDVSLGLVHITGEISQLKISKNRWIYFDLKDDYSNVRFWGSIYTLPSPLEDGMKLIVRGVPQMHPKFGFSVTVQAIELVGKGTIKKAAHLLEAKLEKEGLFADDRKRQIAYPPQNIGLITSSEAAAYADFTKILAHRWPLARVSLIDVQVQGERAVGQIVQAINFFNEHSDLPDVIVITRGGGSLEDLQAFNTEHVTRAVALSRIPTLVAIGHETDLSLAERAADRRASTPSNAAELLVPDSQFELQKLNKYSLTLHDVIRIKVQNINRSLAETKLTIIENMKHRTKAEFETLNIRKQLTHALNPISVLDRGFAIVRQQDRIVTSAKNLSDGPFEIEFKDGKKQVQ